ncbi:MAG: DUF916 domain-containing protein [Candidatus Levybacteria bacterium]|nr:DUF916 domain-containing protein [Candidatus Levybacteria bacterium]
MYINCIKLIAVFLLTTYYLILPTDIQAASVSLGIYPPLTEFEVTPPATIDEPITLQNLNNIPITLSVSLRPFVASTKANGEVTFPADNRGVGVNPNFLDYVSLWENTNRVKEVTLAPGQEKIVTLHIEIPDNEFASDYYFSIIFSNKVDQLLENDTLTKDNLTIIKGGVGINVLLTIGPKSRPKGEIEEFSSPAFVQQGPVPFIVRVKNTGEHRTKVKGTILIKNIFNQYIGKIEIKDTNILTNAIRQLQIDNEDSILWKESFLIGRYTAVLTLMFSEQGPIFTRSIVFYAFPLYFSLGVFIAIILLVVIKKRIYKRFHMYNRHKA